ncbi:unnamed protein product [Soboliphyme baturini]|uniref:Uncharacterized protein n=1 Tax=Soboliphyme baturini TaxID=241478 RepID=A0A183IHD8_9BILA|nr:unnamed protein product [Soboliphyme baturini]
MAQVGKFKYFWVVFTGEGKLEEEIGRSIGVASGVLRVLARTVVTKAELNLKTKLSVFKLIFLLIPIYGHKLWISASAERFRLNAFTPPQNLLSICSDWRARSNRTSITDDCRQTHRLLPWDLVIGFAQVYEARVHRMCKLARFLNNLA